MSYGIWKTRGNGWSGFELDGWDTRRWSTYYYFRPEGATENERREERRLARLVKDAEFYGVSDNPRDEDYSFIVWAVGQAKKNRTIESLDTGSDHSLWIAYDRNDPDARCAAIKKQLDKWGSLKVLCEHSSWSRKTHARFQYGKRTQWQKVWVNDRFEYQELVIHDYAKGEKEVAQ